MKRNHTQQTLLLLGGLSALLYAAGCAQMPSDASPQSSVQAPVEHHVVASKTGMFYGWPANNGVWTWDGGKEILVGFSYGNFIEQPGHNIQGTSDRAAGVLSKLARSRDGGRTWKMEDPDHYVGDGDAVGPAPGGILFDASGFAMRVVGVGYHGAYDSQGHFFISNDRGHHWLGPYRLGNLMEDPNLKGMEFTGRTAYLIGGRDTCLLFVSARPKGSSTMVDKSFVAETTDGGKTFHFVSWIVPLTNPYRAVMPAVDRMKNGTIIVALRRRNPADNLAICWVDCYRSNDNGRTWAFLSRVGETGTGNGNPPALVALKDGRLACAYGDRSRVKLFARLTADGGKSWSEESVVREDFQADKFGDKDFGYPRLVQNAKGEIVALYYWATKDLPQQHIVATAWRAKSK